MSLVVTVLVSASVSGVVALAIEYVAKPRLEARKEELLELHRRRRELNAILLRLTTLSAMWAPYIAMRASVLDSEIDRARGQIDEMTRKMWDDIEWYAGTFAGVAPPGRPSPRDIVIQYILGARAIYLSDIPEADKFRILGEISEPLQVTLAGRLSIKRLRALAKLPEVLDKYVPPGVLRACWVAASGAPTWERCLRG